MSSIFDDEDDIFFSPPPLPGPSPRIKNKSRIDDLFGDIDDDDSICLFSANPVKPLQSSNTITKKADDLFSGEDLFSDTLAINSTSKPSSNTIKPKKIIYDPLAIYDEEFFSFPPSKSEPSSNTIKPINKKADNLFSGEDLFSDPLAINSTSKPSSNTKPEKKILKLFDESDNSDDDIRAGRINTNKKEKSTCGFDSLFD